MDIFVKERERLTAVDIEISEPRLEGEDILEIIILFFNVLYVFLGFCDSQATSERPRVNNRIGFGDGIVILVSFR